MKTFKKIFIPFILGVLFVLTVFAIKLYKERPRTIKPIPADISEDYKNIMTPSWLYQEYK